MKTSVLAGSLAFVMLGAQAQQQTGHETATPQAGPETIAQQSIPDAPRPQTTLPGIGLGTVAPGIGTTSSSGEDATPAAAGSAATPAPAARAADDQAENNQTPASTVDYKTFTLAVPVNFVVVPFTVKDTKGRLVHGLESRDIRVYENGQYQPAYNFSRDRFPLSVALVIDQSMSVDDMTRVNNSLGALPSAFSIYDMVSVFTYNNGPKMVTDFTAAQSARLTQAIEMSKSRGREPLMAGSLDGPLSQTTIINNQNFDPGISANRGHSTTQINPPREVHTLNDAILEAAKALSKADRNRRRVIYVISNGNEYGSEAKTKDVIKYLQAHDISVYGTLVGESAIWGIGTLDHLHLPLFMEDNVLPQYAHATGGNFDAEFRTGEIEKSFARIIEEVGDQYTIGYYTHEPFIDGKYRTLEVRVVGHGTSLTILAKKGYWPSAMDVTRPIAPIAAAP